MGPEAYGSGPATADGVLFTPDLLPVDLSAVDLVPADLFPQAVLARDLVDLDLAACRVRPEPGAAPPTGIPAPLAPAPSSRTLSTLTPLSLTPPAVTPPARTRRRPAERTRRRRYDPVAPYRGLTGPPVGQPAPPVRLTRRGRLAITVVAASLLGAGLLAAHVHSDAAAAGRAGATPAASRTVVRAGDTLWAIARRVAPGSDPRRTVGLIRDRNHLNGAPLQPGQVLLLDGVGGR